MRTQRLLQRRQPPQSGARVFLYQERVRRVMTFAIEEPSHPLTPPPFPLPLPLPLPPPPPARVPACSHKPPRKRERTRQLSHLRRRGAVFVSLRVAKAVFFFLCVGMCVYSRCGTASWCECGGCVRRWRARVCVCARAFDARSVLPPRFLGNKAKVHCGSRAARFQGPATVLFVPPTCGQDATQHMLAALG